MDGGRGRLVNIILGIILVVSLGLLFLENATAITGHASEGYTTSNVTISKYLSIDFSTGLQEGIYFGVVDVLPSTDINATHNYDGASNETTYFINVSTDSNTAVDFCILANSGMTNGAAGVIGLDNETYHASNETSNWTNPDVNSQVSITTSFVKAVNYTVPGQVSNWRFWLDIPVAQETGNYNNTISFRGVGTGLVCGS
ncbi:hypothetical protein GW931_00075 [archaeon]|nr:hypothetical protein [archaeon]